MSEVYVDTSLLGAYYCPEPLSAQAEAYLQALERPVISLLTEVEFFSLVSRKRRAGDFGISKARKVLMAFQSHLESGLFRIIVPTFEHFMSAREMIGTMKTPLQTLDALHLSIAKEEGLPMVTADGVLAGAARVFQVKTDLVK